MRRELPAGISTDKFVRHDDAVVLGFRVGCVCMCFFSRVRAGFVCSLQVVVEKKVERCKGSVEFSDFTSKVSQQDRRFIST